MKSRWKGAGLFAALLLYLSLYPYRFDWSRTVSQWSFDWPRTEGDWVDSLLNLIAYIPLGILASRAGGAWKALGLGIALSASVEILQSYLPSRHSSVRDLIINSAGTALGYAFSGYGLRFLSSRLHAWAPLLEARLAMLAWAIWLSWIAIPFLPILRRHQLSRIAESLAQPQWNGERTVDQALLFALLCLLSPIEKRRCVLLALVALSGSCFVYGFRFQYADLLGLGAGLLILRLPLRVLASLWLLWLGWKQFHGIPGGTLSPFEWWPFAGFSWEPFGILRTLAGKALLYGGCIWALLRAGWPRAWAFASVVSLLAAGEAAQVYFPGRSPESTDPLLAFGMGFLFMRLEQQSKA